MFRRHDRSQLMIGLCSLTVGLRADVRAITLILPALMR
jgi:hypothetical protein